MVSSNIKSGVTIFGVSGTLEVTEEMELISTSKTCSAGGTITIPRTTILENTVVKDVDGDWNFFSSGKWGTIAKISSVSSSTFTVKDDTGYYDFTIYYSYWE